MLSFVSTMHALLTNPRARNNTSEQNRTERRDAAELSILGGDRLTPLHSARDILRLRPGPIRRRAAVCDSYHPWGQQRQRHNQTQWPARSRARAAAAALPVVAKSAGLSATGIWRMRKPRGTVMNAKPMLVPQWAAESPVVFTKLPPTSTMNAWQRQEVTATAMKTELPHRPLSTFQWFVMDCARRHAVTKTHAHNRDA